MRKTGQRWHLHNEAQLTNFAAFLRAQWREGKKPIVQFMAESRSLDQNALIRHIYKEIHRQVDDQSLIDIERHCKLHYGVPILLAEDEEFAAVYRKGIKSHLTYGEKLQAMDILPVTSRMDVDQASQYIDAAIADWGTRGVFVTKRGDR